MIDLKAELEFSRTRSSNARFQVGKKVYVSFLTTLPKV